MLQKDDFFIFFKSGVELLHVNMGFGLKELLYMEKLLLITILYSKLFIILKTSSSLLSLVNCKRNYVQVHKRTIEKEGSSTKQLCVMLISLIDYNV